MQNYFGSYADFQTESKEEAAVLLGAETAIGDVCAIEPAIDEGAHRAWLVNGYDRRIGFFDEGFSRKLSLLAADGLELRAILSLIAFTDHPDDGHYWGQAAVIGYNPAYGEELSAFVANVAREIGRDVRPRIDLGAEAFDKVVASDGAWLPDQRMPLPDAQKGMAIIKRRRSVTDKLIEQGRAGNKGCYVASWAFLLALVALIVVGLKSCFGW